jgi:DNA-binding winged helix-turn-helix (wHTH) protein/predicted ATPase
MDLLSGAARDSRSRLRTRLRLEGPDGQAPAHMVEHATPQLLELAEAAKTGAVPVKKLVPSPPPAYSSGGVMSAPTYRFDRFVLDLQRGVLLADDTERTLRPKSFALLRLLVENAGRLIDRDEIMRIVWPGVFVTDDSIAQCVRDIRRALGNNGDQFLRTLPRRGYRFIAPVVAEPEKTVTAPPPQVEADRDVLPLPGHDAERRQITAMSCELIGLSERGDTVDLETLREAVVALQHVISEIAARYDGFIVNRQGNTLLILFGYPAAHEHNAEEAVRAGLELCAAVRGAKPGADGRTECRIGVATGVVIIGNPAEDGEPGPQEIVGNAPVLAARLQLTARPNTVVIDAATRRLIGNLFDCRDLDTLETASDTEPMHRWQVLAARVGESRFEALRGPALSPLIGRDEEIDLLLRRWRRAKTGDGQVVLIAGEPGIGKSRLTAELEFRLDAEPHVRLRYFCSPYHQDTALHPIADQLGRASGFVPDDPPEARLEKLETLLARAAAPDEDVALIADLLALPISERHLLPNLSPQRKKERTLEALLDQLEALARRQPLLMVFEDAHWVDPTSHELLDLAIERIRTLPVLLIVTFRPGFENVWIGQPQVTMLTLNRLDRRDRSALVVQIAGTRALRDEVVDQLVDRSDGVPLFIEELTKSVLESGASLVAIPTTLHDSLMARIDRLGSARLVAQIGAAMGRQFPYGLVRAVSDLPEDELHVALARLVASELVFQRGTPPEAVYTFKHALLQDAAHGSLLRDARQRLHRQIAEALRAHSPELMETQPELLARHYAEAGMAEQSAFFWGKAGTRSLARSAMTEATTQLQEALNQLALLPKTVERKRQELEYRVALGTALRAVKGFAAPETGRALSRARELWEEQGSPQEFINIPFAQATYHGLRHERNLALSLIDEVLRLSHQRNDASGLILGYSENGEILMFAGEFASSRSHLERALAVREPSFHSASFTHDPLLPAGGNLAIVLFCLGYPDQALAASRATVAKAQRLGQPASLTLARIFDAILLSLAGDNAALDARAGELIAASTEHGFALYRAQGAIFRGSAMVKHGNVPEGICLLRSGLSAYRATGSEVWMPHYGALLATALEIAGQTEEAAGLLDDALHTVERTGERWFEAELNRLKGEFLLRQGYCEAALELYRKALRIAEAQQAKLWELRAAVSLARRRRDQDRHTDARAVLAPVYGWFTEGFDTPDLKEAKSLLDEVA